MEEASSHSVVLHVYDLSRGLARQLSQTLLGTAIDAVYHTGVVAYGTEYWFGAGIQRGVPGRTDFGPPMEAIRLGCTEIPRDLFEQFLADVSVNYSPHRYSLLSHNCNHFSDEVAHFLLGRGIPSRILDLPRHVLSSPQGALLAPLLQQLETTLKYGAAPRAPFPAPSPISGSPSYSIPAQLLHPPPTSVPAPTTPDAALNPSSALPAVGAAAAGAAAVAFRTQCDGGVDARQMGAKGQSDASDAAERTSTPAAAPATSTAPAIASASASASPSASAAASAAGSAEARAKEAVHAEIRREFAALMAAGGLAASEAAAAAVRRVVARHGLTAAAAAP
ncbi:unnamed protein product [Closterium sp. NIES-65]|nr:unnamed protein product [Closterium sp. NIES-65]